MKYLIDTGWITDHLKGDGKVVRKLQELASDGVAVSVISLAEIHEGVYYSRDPIKSQELFAEFFAPDLSILNVDQEVSKVFGKQRGR